MTQSIPEKNALLQSSDQILNHPNLLRSSSNSQVRSQPPKLSLNPEKENLSLILGKQTIRKTWSTWTTHHSDNRQGNPLQRVKSESLILHTKLPVFSMSKSWVPFVERKNHSSSLLAKRSVTGRPWREKLKNWGSRHSKAKKKAEKWKGSVTNLGNSETN